MASTKVVCLMALLLVLELHMAHCYFGPFGYGGYGFPVGYNDDNDMDILLPILLLAMTGRGNFGGYGSPPCGGCGGCGGGCGCGRC